MKGIIVWAGLLAAPLAAGAQSSTVARICNRFSDGDSIIRCLKAADGRALDEEAAKVCNRFWDGDSIIRCVGAAAGRVYQPGEVAVCNRFWDGDSIIACLGSAGREARRERRGHGRRSLRSALRECRRENAHDREVLRCLELLAEEDDD